MTDHPTKAAGADREEGRAMPENFISYEQIEPLLTPGMDANELKAALCKLTGLDPKTYRFVTRTFTGRLRTFAECLRDGLYVERYDTPDGTSEYIYARGEVLR